MYQEVALKEMTATVINDLKNLTTTKNRLDAANMLFVYLRYISAFIQEAEVKDTYNTHKMTIKEGLKTIEKKISEERDQEKQIELANLVNLCNDIQNKLGN